MKIKVKIHKGQGCREIVVNDPKINAKYDATNSKPVVLASMVEFFNSGCWGVLDLRISKHKVPSPYLEAGSCFYKPSDEADKEKITSELHTYRLEKSKDGEYVTWNTWDVNCWDGDNPSCQSKTGYLYNQVARFTYKGALQRLAEIREFWEKFEGDNIESVRLENPYRQKSETHFSMMKFILEEKEKANKALKKKEAKPDKSMKPSNIGPSNIGSEIENQTDSQIEEKAKRAIEKKMDKALKLKVKTKKL